MTNVSGGRMTCLFRSLEKTNSKQQCFHEIFFSMFSRVHFVLDKVARNASHSILKSRIVSKNASLKQSKDFLGQRKLLYLECQKRPTENCHLIVSFLQNQGM